MSEEGNAGPDEFETCERVANIRCYSTELGNQLMKFLWCIWMIKEASHSIGIKWRGKRRISAFWSFFCTDNLRRRNHVVSRWPAEGSRVCWPYTTSFCFFTVNDIHTSLQLNWTARKSLILAELYERVSLSSSNALQVTRDNSGCDARRQSSKLKTTALIYPENVFVTLDYQVKSW